MERLLREKEREEFGYEIEWKEREIRAAKARKKREREARELGKSACGLSSHFLHFCVTWMGRVRK